MLWSMEELGFPNARAEKLYRIKDELYCVKWEKEEAIRQLDFLRAAQLRDRARELEKLLREFEDD